MISVTVITISLAMFSSLAADNTNTAPTENSVTFPQQGGKGPGMGHDYQKNTPSLTQGEPNYQGGQPNGSVKSSQENNNSKNKIKNLSNKSQLENQQIKELTVSKPMESQKGLNTDSLNPKPAKSQSGAGAGYPGYRGQGGVKYPQHKQFGNPPIQQEKIPSQTPNNQVVKKSPVMLAAEKRRALLHAAGFGDVVTLNKLLKEGGNPNARAKNKTKRTALILAAIGGKLEAVNALLAHGAKLEDRDFAGNTALNWAALRGHTQVASTLIKKSANINTQNNAGASPLHYAVSTQNIPLVKLIIENKADLEIAASKYKVTPLQIAIKKKDITSLNILLENGVKVNDIDREIIKKILAGN